MSIENPTLSAAADLAHFMHFIRRGGFSSLFTKLPSTSVEKALQISPFYAKQTQCQVRQNEHKLLYDNDICKNGHLVIQTNKPKTNPKQTQLNPIQSQFKPNSKPIQTQFPKGQKLMQSIYLQRVMMIKPYCGFVKTKPIKANNQSSLITNHLEGKPQTNPISDSMLAFYSGLYL